MFKNLNKTINMIENIKDYLSEIENFDSSEAEKIEEAIRQAGAIRTWIYQMGGTEDV